MNRELYIHTLRMLREQYEIARMDTVVETIDVALWAIETQEQLKQERDAAIAALHIDSAYAEGWTAAESKYKAMMKGGKNENQSN